MHLPSLKEVSLTMMDTKTFTTHHLNYRNLVRRVVARRGVPKHDVEEVCQDIWAELWKYRALWPDPAPSNPGAYLAKCAVHRCQMYFRSASTMKRSAAHLPIEEDRTSTANIKLSRAPEVDGLVERTSLGTLMRRFAEKLPPEKKKTLLDRLDDKSEKPLSAETSVARRGLHRMIDACRKHLGISVRDPQSARVDPFTRLADVVHGTFIADPDPDPSDAE